MSAQEWKRPLPVVGDRVHMDCRPKGFFWGACVRAVVDGHYLVLRRWGGAHYHYWMESRYSWESGHIKPGPLPRKPPVDVASGRVWSGRWNTWESDDGIRVDVAPLGGCLAVRGGAVVSGYRTGEEAMAAADKRWPWVAP